MKIVGTPQNFLLVFIDELWKTQKIRILKKKMLEILSFYTCVPKTTIIWGTVPEIQSETEFFVILDHFLPSYPLLNKPENRNFEKMKKASWDVTILNLCKKKHNHTMYVTQIWSVTDISCSSTSLLTLKIKIWKKGKKTPGDIIFLHMCTIDQDHMMYGSWDIKCKGQSFLSFWAIFCPFIHLTTLKNHSCTTNDDNMIYGSWDIECNRHNLSFWAIVCTFIPLTLTTQKIKLLKKWKKLLEILSFYTQVS